MTREIVSGLYLYTATDRALQRGQLLTRRTVEALPTVADTSVLEVSEMDSQTCAARNLNLKKTLLSG